MNNPGYSKKIILNDDTVITGVTVRCIDPLTECSFSTLTDSESTTNGTTTTSLGEDYGSIIKPIYGAFTNIKLASGSAILYY